MGRLPLRVLGLVLLTLAVVVASCQALVTSVLPEEADPPAGSQRADP